MLKRVFFIYATCLLVMAMANYYFMVNDTSSRFQNEHYCANVNESISQNAGIMHKAWNEHVFTIAVPKKFKKIKKVIMGDENVRVRTVIRRKALKYVECDSYYVWMADDRWEMFEKKDVRMTRKHSRFGKNKIVGGGMFNIWMKKRVCYVTTAVYDIFCGKKIFLHPVTWTYPSPPSGAVI